MTDSVKAIIEQITAIQWVAFAVIAFLVISGIANLLDSLRKIYAFFRDIFVHLKGRKMSDIDLKNQALSLAKQLMDFVQIRQDAEPPFTFERFEESSSLLIKHSQTTQNLYARDFAGQLANLRIELIKRGLQDRELDQFYQHPTNYIGLRILAMRLAALGEQVRAKA